MENGVLRIDSFEIYWPLWAGLPIQMLQWLKSYCDCMKNRHIGIPKIYSPESNLTLSAFALIWIIDGKSQKPSKLILTLQQGLANFFSPSNPYFMTARRMILDS